MTAVTRVATEDFTTSLPKPTGTWFAELREALPPGTIRWAVVGVGATHVTIEGVRLFGTPACSPPST